MARFTGTGTCISVSTAAPATHDSAGFTNVAMVYTQIGELESFSDIMQDHQAVNFVNLCTGKNSTAKGSENPIEFEITVAMDRDDAGQAILTAARKSLTQIISFKAVDSSGDSQYLRAYVLGEKIAGGAGPNDIRMGTFKFGVVAPATGDTVVVVNAA